MLIPTDTEASIWPLVSWPRLLSFHIWKITWPILAHLIHSICYIFFGSSIDFHWPPPTLLKCSSYDMALDGRASCQRHANLNLASLFLFCFFHLYHMPKVITFKNRWFGMTTKSDLLSYKANFSWKLSYRIMDSKTYILDYMYCIFCSKLTLISRVLIALSEKWIFCFILWKHKIKHYSYKAFTRYKPINSELWASPIEASIIAHCYVFATYSISRP